MESILKRHLNLVVLVGVLFAQMIGLAAQVKRQTESGPVRLIRMWAVSAVTPVERAIFGSGRAVRGFWGDYIDLRGVRQQNDELRAEVQRLRLEELRLSEDTAQARRLKALLGFKEQFASQTLPAQVISTTGSEFSKGVYIDKGSSDGVRPDMPVITPDGIVGKILRTYPHSSLVLEINDPTSGAGVILQKSRLQGILKGTSDGEVRVANIMADEKVEVGERVLTSGGDRVFPKGMPVGTVSRTSPAGTFLQITVHPAAELERVEEVLVVTKITERPAEVNEADGPLRASDILAERLPSIPEKPTAPGTTPAAAPGTTQAGTKPGEAKPAVKPAPQTATNAEPPPPPRLKPPAVPDRFSPPGAKPATASASDALPAAAPPVVARPPAAGNTQTPVGAERATTPKPAADKKPQTAQAPKPEPPKGPQQ